MHPSGVGRAAWCMRSRSSKVWKAWYAEFFCSRFPKFCNARAVKINTTAEENKIPKKQFVSITNDQVSSCLVACDAVKLLHPTNVQLLHTLHWDIFRDKKVLQGYGAF